MFRAEYKASSVGRAFRSLKASSPRIQMRALNRAVATTKTNVSRAVSKDMGLKVGTVKKAMIVTKAKLNQLSASIAASLKRVPLIDFGAKGPEPSRGRGRGVTAKTGGARKRYPHAFITSVGSGHRGVFERRGDTRLPIRELRGPSIGLVFQKHRDEGKKVARTAYLKELTHQIRRAMQTAAGRG